MDADLDTELSVLCMALEKDIRCAEKIILEKTKLVLSDGQEIWWSVAAVLVCFGLSRPSLCVKVGTGGPVVASTTPGMDGRLGWRKHEGI